MRNDPPTSVANRPHVAHEFLENPRQSLTSHSHLLCDVMRLGGSSCNLETLRPHVVALCGWRRLRTHPATNPCDLDDPGEAQCRIILPGVLTKLSNVSFAAGLVRPIVRFDVEAEHQRWVTQPLKELWRWRQLRRSCLGNASVELRSPWNFHFRHDRSPLCTRFNAEELSFPLRRGVSHGRNH